MTEREQAAREEAAVSVVLMQEFDVQTLPRKVDLGNALNFEKVVEPAQRLVDLFKQLTPTALDDFPWRAVIMIKKKADEAYNTFDQILKFDTESGIPTERRATIIQAVEKAYNTAFTDLHPYISYSLYRTIDFSRLDTEVHETLKSIKDKAKKVTFDLIQNKMDSDKILEKVRAVAAEQGVSQQASYFHTEAEKHDTQAGKWKTATTKMGWVLFIYAFVTVFLHKIPVLVPNTTYDTVQLAVSKVLMFAVISFMLYLAARNFLSHTHNAIVNRHRENALKTYQVLVDAAGDTSNREAVLLHAAACIYSPQSTGYDGNNSTPGQGAHSVVELLTKPVSSGG